MEEAIKGDSAPILILAFSIFQTDSGYPIKMICIPKVRRNLSPQKVLGRGSPASNYKALIHAPRQRYHPDSKPIILTISTISCVLHFRICNAGSLFHSPSLPPEPAASAPPHDHRFCFCSSCWLRSRDRRIMASKRSW